ncbi:MAG: thioredoxin domain-containing protein [Actinomycetota bacterium]
MNRLAAESSPYLRQHADNPVEWFPWGSAAFDAARTRDLPILLSIGYSSCHWCHVMAHESFEDPATAELMNELFVNIKVDREERPDVDAIYMEAVQALTGRGGWPMTVFLTPDGEPFFAGTYFPPDSRQGMPGFGDVLERISEAWRDARDDVRSQAAELTAAVGRAARLQPDSRLPEGDVVAGAVSGLRTHYDAAWGGFGSAPKFPHTMALDALLRAHAHTGEDDVLQVVSNSLDAMASGGIYDHLGGGFARYSTDAQWIVPHFEKMLYDNALFLRTYLHAWQVTGKTRYLQVVDEIITYVLRDLRSPEGGFYSAEDADSEGVEGKFYVWSPEQIQMVLGDDAAEFGNWYGVTPEGNFEGRNILWRPNRGDLLRPASIELSRQRLFQAREMRIRPGLDDKVLAEWNGLMLSSLAEAAFATSNHQWLTAALRNGEFLLDAMRRPDGRWLRSWQEGAAGLPGGARHLAVAADLAAVIDAFVRLAEASGQARWIVAATETADQLIDLFWDEEHGGVFSTGSDADPLITRPKDLADGSVPSANSAAATALLRLGALTGAQRFTDRATDILRLLGRLAVQQPMGFANVVCALDMARRGFTEVVIPGDNQELLDVLRLRYQPNTVLAWGEPYDSPLWAGRDNGHAYVCHDFTCALPATTQADLAAQLEST